MSVKINNGKVVYVEPNIGDDFMSYSSQNIGDVYKSVPLEEMSVVVGLQVEVKGRIHENKSYGSDGNVQRMVWQSSADGQTISFMQGSKLKTQNMGDIYSLTTNYTDIHLYDIMNEGTSEMFGIKSIDISYNNFMVPEVTIQFVDVRGVSVFAQEEMRHNLSDGEMNGIANNDIEGSFFKSFFTFPYPKFTLFVKGFYGQMVSYELTCSDFRAAFDSNTGNFNVTAKFVGYAFSFLSDIMVNGLVGAPYSEYLGAKYWDDNITNGRFTVENRDGSKEIPMEKLAEVCKRYREIEQKVAKEIEERGYAEVAKDLHYGEKEQETLKDSDIEPVRQAYNKLIDKLKSIGEFINSDDGHKKQGDKCITSGSSNSCCIVVEENHNKEIEDLMSEFKTFNDITLPNYKGNFEDLKNWGHSFAILRYDDYTDILEKGKKTIKTEIIDTPLEDNLRKAVEWWSDQTCLDYDSDGDKKYYDAWTDKADASTVYIYKDFGLGEMLSEKVNLTSKNEQVATDLRKKVEQDVLKKKFKEVFLFEPSVENITKIIMAHVETFIYMVSECANTIIGQGTKRSVGNMGIPVGQFPDTGGNNSIGVDENTIVAPFPKATEFKKEGDVTRQQDEWIGRIGNLSADNTEEIKLVEGLLNGIGQAANEINKAAPDYNSSAPSREKTNILYPLTYFDLLLNDGDSVFGKINLSDVNDVFAKFCVRAFSVLATHEKTNISASLYGNADAENFLEKYGDSNELKNLSSMINAITVEKVMNFYTNSDTSTYGLDKSKKSNPWLQASHLIDKVGDSYKLSVGDYGEKNNVFPTKNWSFKELYDIADSQNGLKNKNFGDKYITTFCKDNDDDRSAVVFDIREASVQYFKNCIGSLQNSKYNNENGFVGKVFTKAKSFDFDGWGGTYDYSSGSGLKFYDSKGETYNEVESVIKYDSNGNVKPNNAYAISLQNIFLKKSFLNLQSTKERAKEFIRQVFTNKFGRTQEKTWADILKSSEIKNKTQFAYVPKFSVLRDGAYFMDTKDKHGIRPTIVNKYIEYFNEWAEKEYPKIEAAFSLDIRSESSIDKLTSSAWRVLQSCGENLSQVVDEIHNNLTAEGCVKFDKTYTIVRLGGRKMTIDGKPETDDVGGIFLKTKPSSEMSEMLQDLMKVVSVCALTKFNTTDAIYHKDARFTPYLEKAEIEGYLTGVIETLKNNLSSAEGSTSTSKINVNNDPDDIKVGVYNYIKMLYDKWIAADTKSDFYRLENLFDGGNPTFQFIDSVYTKIGKTMYLNLKTLVDRIYQSQTQNGYTLLSMLSSLYADNKFLFLCIQNFMDLAHSDMMDKMFKPISYLDVKEPNNRPNFIVLMPYEPSSKLDVQGADYPDDGFYLNDETSWPPMIKEKPDGNPIPAFGVCYGQQYQNYFKDIQVDMNTPMVTEQSIKAKFMIAGVGDGTDNNGPKMVTAGQDLYTIYSNNSYTCTVTMMGCAWVQPMMYFVLQNVPMFRGSYMIVKVNHQIQPGNMITTFKGIRMAKTATRAVEEPIFGYIQDSVGVASESGGESIESGGYARVSNDCNYAYYDPLQRRVTVPSNADAQAYCYAAYQMLRNENLTDAQAKGILANIKQESQFNPYVVIIDGNDDPKTGSPHHGLGGGLVGFYFYKGVWVESGKPSKAQEVYTLAYGPEGGKEILVAQNKELNDKYWTGSVYTVNKAKIMADGNKFKVPFEKQMEYICQKTHEAPYNAVRDCQTETDAAKAWLATFEKGGTKATIKNETTDRWNYNGNGNWIINAIETKEKIKHDAKNSADNESLEYVAEGLRKSVEQSLQTSQYYHDAKVNVKHLSGDVFEYTTQGDTCTNAMFDCFINQYSDWFSFIRWNVGTKQTNSDASSIQVAVRKDATSNHKINIVGLDKDNFVYPKITKKEELNESFRLALIKYFKQTDTNSAEKIKDIFTNCTMDDKIIEDIFEVRSSKLSVADCDSVMGSNSRATAKKLGTNPSGKIDEGIGKDAYPLKKSIRTINLIGVHCTADPEGKDNNVFNIRDFHVNKNGWSTIGYHYVIYRDGRIVNGRNVDYSGAHIEGHNSNSIGVSYVGGLASIPNTPYKNLPPKDTRTPEQKASLLRLLTDLKAMYPNAEIRSHRDFAAKSCPSFDATAEYANI